MENKDKSEVYSWRVSAALKSELEAAARAKKTSVSKLLESLVKDWLKSQRLSPNQAEQERFRVILAATAGVCESDGKSATNARVREVMGAALEGRYGKLRAR